MTPPLVGMVMATLIAIIAATTVATWTSTGVSEPQNLLSIDQHTFSSIDGWHPRERAAITQSTVLGYDDATSLQLNVVAAGTASAGTPGGSDGIPVSDGRRYAGALRVQPATAVGRVSCQLLWYGADGEPLGVAEGPIVAEVADEWTEVRCAGQAPPDAGHIELQVLFHEARQHEVHHVDDAVLFDTTLSFEGRLLVSEDPGRSGPMPLSGTSQTGLVYTYVEVSDPSIVASVAFAVDGISVRTDDDPPYDLAGGGATGARPYDASQLTLGDHTVTATVTLIDGTTRILSATFTVAESAIADPGTGRSEGSPPTRTEAGGWSEGPSPAPGRGPEGPSPPAAGGPAHGTDVTADNTGLRGAGYVYDPATDAFTHPDRGPLEVIDGSLATSHDGQVIEGVEVHGSITVGHRDVVIRNVRVIYGGTLYAIDGFRHAPADADLQVEFAEIEHTGGPDAYRSDAVRGRSTSVSRSNIHGGFGTCIVHHTTGSSYHNFCHELTRADGAHTNGIALERTDDVGGPFRVVGNRTEGGTTATITMFARHGPFQDVIVADNFLSGGTSPSYCFHGPENKGAASGTRDVRVIGNVFDRDPYRECGQYGPYRHWNGDRPGAVWCHNRFVDGEDVGVDVGC